MRVGLLATLDMLPTTSASEFTTDTDYPRHAALKKRRPALACEQCRRRKVKCDRQIPCRQCTKAKIGSCRYFQDTRPELLEAPFQPHDIQFSIFEQNLRNISTVAPLPTPTCAPTPSIMETSASPSPVLASFLAHDLTVASSALSAPSPSAGEPDAYSNPSKPFPLADLAAATKAPFRGVFFKTRFHGQSHWMNFVLPYSETLTLIQNCAEDDAGNGHATFADCKGVGRYIKMQESRTTHFFGSVRDMVPSRLLADQLIQAYLRTFQTVFGILHVPSFRADYELFWTDPASLGEMFNITLLLVMCIGSAFHVQENSISRTTILRWIQFASAWLSLPTEKARLNLDGLRIHCLFLLARQVKSVGGEMSWLSTGSLLRSAMQMGLHIDPGTYPFPSSCSEIESRRRLWATILELEIQSGMDSGTMPSIDRDDFDCAPPLNIDDASLESGWQAGIPVTPKPMNQFTQSSIQALLMIAMPVRLQVSRSLNGFRSQDSFEHTLSLSADLLTVMKDCYGHLESYRMSSSPPSAFQTKLFHLLVDRFLLCLHHPFAATGNPLHYYSRKACLETSLSLFSQWTQPGEDDFHRLLFSGTGLFRDVYTEMALYACGELMDRSKDYKSLPMNASSMSCSREIDNLVQSYLKLTEVRLGAYERNINFHVLVSCLLEQTRAMQAGAPVEQRVSDALKQSLQTCYSLLKARSHTMLELNDSLTDLGTIGVEFG